MLKDTALACAVLTSRSAHPSGGERLGDADWLSGQPEGPWRSDHRTGHKAGGCRTCTCLCPQGEHCPMLRLTHSSCDLTEGILSLSCFVPSMCR